MVCLFPKIRIFEDSRRVLDLQCWVFPCRGNNDKVQPIGWVFADLEETYGLGEPW